MRLRHPRQPRSRRQIKKLLKRATHVCWMYDVLIADDRFVLTEQEIVEAGL